MLLTRLATSLFLVVFSRVALGQSMVDLYRPLFEAQRGPLREPNSENISQLCVEEFENINKSKEILYALDAFGKPEPGLKVGNLAWLGHFSECSNLKDFHYCHINMEIMVSEPLQLQWGVCVPRECSFTDVENSFHWLIDILPVDSDSLNFVNKSSATCVDRPVVPYGPGFIACMVICALLGILMLGGSVIDVLDKWSHEGQGNLSVQSGDIEPLISNPDNEAINNGIYPLHQMETGWKRGLHKVLSGMKILFLDFALNRNLGKLMKIGKNDERNIECLNGIRVLSMFWVILGHVYFFPVTYGGLFNPLDTYSWTKNFVFQTVLNAYFSVDSFFFLSGLLVCYLTLLKLEKKHGKFPWPLFYVHRYIRLTPVMLATILIWMYIAPYTLWGPKAALMGKRPFCPDYWWANVLYIQNFYPPKFGNACIGWTWYLANDMQFFVISPIIIYALYRAPFIGFGLVGSLLATSFAITGTLTYKYDFPASPTSQISNHTQTADFGNILYQKPYVRIPPYLVGMLLGYTLHRLKDKPFIISRPLLALGWSVASTIAMLTVYGLLGNYHDHKLGRGANMMYEMFSRFAWSIFLCWVVISCKFSKAGWVNNILSWSIWIPFSRLTYTAYLLHPIIITTFIGNSGLPYYASQVLQTYYFFGAVLMSYGCAAILSLTVEFPLANLEKHILPKM